MHLCLQNSVEMQLETVMEVERMLSLYYLSFGGFG